MLLSEPPETAYDIRFTCAGFPVRIHPFFWLVTILLANSADPTNVLIWIFVVFVSILIHELGHAFAMKYFGFSPRITLYGLGGLASYDQGFTPSYDSYSSAGNDTRSQVIISAAGPAAGFVFAGIVIALLYAFNLSSSFLGWPIGGSGQIASAYANEFVYQLLFVNIAWGIINLFPVYPLDGGKISRELFIAFNSAEGLRRSLVLSIVCAIALSAFAILQMRWMFGAILFGAFAYNSYQMLQQTGGFNKRPW